MLTGLLLQCGRAKVRRALTENAALAGPNVVSIAAAPGWCATLKQPPEGEAPVRNECLTAVVDELKAAGIGDYQIARGSKHLQIRWREGAARAAPLRAMMLKPSCLISCSHSSPEGGLRVLWGGTAR
jgi:hypothetical protein